MLLQQVVDKLSEMSVQRGVRSSDRDCIYKKARRVDASDFISIVLVIKPARVNLRAVGTARRNRKTRKVGWHSNIRGRPFPKSSPNSSGQ